MDSLLARFFLAAVVGNVLPGCQGSPRPSQINAPGPTVVAREASVAAGQTASAGPVSRDYSIELAMGARCPEGDSQASLMTWPIRGACNGPGPVHLMRVMQALEPSIRWSDDARRALRASRQSYVGVAGLGKHPDFFMVLDSVWIRSFEGIEEDDTVYLVQASFCLTSKLNNAVSTEDANCSGSYGLKAYAIDSTGEVKEVTSGTMPLPPRMTLAERRRYGPYMASSLSEARDEDIELQADRLQYVPTMRWALGSFDPETPLPESDPRYQGALGEAHFGFVVWDGQRFQVLERVPRSMWPNVDIKDPTRSVAGTGNVLPDRYVVENGHSSRTTRCLSKRNSI